MEHGLEIRFDGINKEEFFNRSDSRVSVLSGTNNSGKSLLLKLLFEHYGEDSYLCGTNRYYDIQHFPVYNEDPNFIPNTWKGIKAQINAPNYNHEPVTMTFSDVFIRLTDDERENVYKFCSDYLDETVKLDFVSPNNSMSNSFLTIGDTPIAQSSSGCRMLIHLVSILFTKRFKVVLIDEPELGLTPRIQNAIQRLIFKHLDESLAHLQHLYIATHSHIFLSQRRVNDNFLVQKSDKTINVKRISTYQGFRDLQFAQLGNSFEQLQLPSGFMILEGKTDFKYLKRLIQLKVPDNRANIVHANGDGEIKKKVHDLLEVIGTLDTSPYSNRVLVVLDETHSSTLPSDLEKQGCDEQCVFEWKHNGIEYYYPEKILQGIFKDDSLTATDLKLDGDRVSHKGIEMTKNDLCNAVLDGVTESEQLDDELEALLQWVHSLNS